MGVSKCMLQRFYHINIQNRGICRHCIKVFSFRKIQNDIWVLYFSQSLKGDFKGQMKIKWKLICIFYKHDVKIVYIYYKC